MVDPGGVSATGGKGGLQSPVHSFDHAIGFGVVGGGVMADRSQKACQGSPKLGGERGAPIGSEVFRDAKARDPGVEEGVGAGGSSSLTKGNDFRPASGAINHSK